MAQYDYQVGCSYAIYWSISDPRKFGIYIDNAALPEDFIISSAMYNATYFYGFVETDTKVVCMSTANNTYRQYLDDAIKVLLARQGSTNLYEGKVMVDTNGDFSSVFVSGLNPEPMWASWNWDDMDWEIPANIDELKLNYAQEQRRISINAAYNNELYAGVTCGGVVYQTDDLFRTRVRSYAFENALRREDDIMQIEDREGITHDFTKEQILELATCLNAFMRSLRSRKDLCMAQIAVATTPQEVAQIVWPPSTSLDPFIQEINPMEDVAAYHELKEHKEFDAPKWKDVAILRQDLADADARLAAIEKNQADIMNALATPLTPIKLIPGTAEDILLLSQGVGYTVDAPYGGVVRVEASSLLNLGLVPLGILYFDGVARYNFEGLVETAPQTFAVKPGQVVTTSLMQSAEFTPWVEAPAV